MCVIETEVAVIGAGQAGLSAGYHLRRAGLEPGNQFVMLDRSPAPGGAWQYRWPSLTLSTVNRVHDLPGMEFAETLGHHAPDAVIAAEAVPRYYQSYEEKFDLQVQRPVAVTVVCDREPRFRVEAGDLVLSARGLINATGTWEKPFIPHYRGAQRFRGRQLHTKDFFTADEYVGKHVIVVGGGISAVQLLDEISQVTSTTWVTRREPEFREGNFGADTGRAAVAIVEDRVRAGLLPGSVVLGYGISQRSRSSGATAATEPRRRHSHGRATRDSRRVRSPSTSPRVRTVGKHHRRQPRRASCGDRVVGDSEFRGLKAFEQRCRSFVGATNVPCGEAVQQ